jgi:O-acetyl-ADP-ribose deacetylase (regulator of RNase III)
VSERRAFVISPIGDEGSDTRKHADQVFRHIIAPALAELDVEPIRSDHLTEPGRISEQMFREILDDDLCIAVLTFFNPNVFYELAIAQCASRPVVILLLKGQKPPFDIADLRVIAYDLDVDAIQSGDYARALTEQVREVLAPGFQPVNPLTLSGREWSPEQRARIEKLVETSRPAVLAPGVDAVFARAPGSEQRIILRTGDIQHVRGVDVLVSSENTDLQLSRYFDPSMSGTLRYLDAERDAGGSVIRDSLHDALQAQIERLEIRLPVRAGTVIATPADGLRKHGAKYVFSVAAVRGEVGQGYSTVLERVDACVMNVYERFAELAAHETLESVLLPILGAGAARLDPTEAVRRMLPYVCSAMESVPACRETHVLARIESHRKAVADVADELGLERVT